MATSLIINGETIPAALLQEEFEVIKAGYERMGAMSCCERDPEFRGYARENVIARTLLNQEAERRFPQLDPAELAAALDRIAAEHGGLGALCERLGVSGPDDPLLQEDLRAGLRMDKLILSAAGQESAPAESELVEFYNARQDEYLTAERVKATHLFKQVEKVEEREMIYDTMRQWRREARRGADFMEIALANTDKEDKAVDLGWFGRGEFSDEFDLILFSLEEGEMSPVFASHWGFHLAQVTGREPARPKPFAEVADAVREQYLTSRRQEATQALARDLMAGASIQEAEE
jgi:parvulin-like peptidyl-prolyl isomerase